MECRRVSRSVNGNRVMEGAGVSLRRMAGFYEKEWLDPFLMLDYFGSADEVDYMAGFPWHPHRGIETVTYMLEGAVRHEDSLGNSGVINTGDVQWMTAGSGIIHQEMPVGGQAPMYGFQLWVNLPRDQKLCHPKYRDITTADIPVVREPGCDIRIIAGTYEGTAGPVHDLVMAPFYYDVTLSPGTVKHFEVPESYNVLACCFQGSGRLGERPEDAVTGPVLVQLESGTTVRAEAGESGLRFLLLGGEPLREPIAWRGPIVMNTDEELRAAFTEYHNNTFLKHG